MCIFTAVLQDQEQVQDPAAFLQHKMLLLHSKMGSDYTMPDLREKLFSLSRHVICSGLAHAHVRLFQQDSRLPLTDG